MNAACILLGLLFLFFGIGFSEGKLHGFLSGWKRLNEEEKEEIDMNALCRNVGGMIALSGFIFLLAGTWELFLQKAFVWAMILWMIAAGLDIYDIGKSGRYERKGGGQKKQNKK